MPQQIYNTLTGNKETFEPMTEGKLTIYVCGPTVYDMSHLGHARVYVAFDSIVRYLRRRYQVTHVRNFTDVDDKILKRAAESNQDASAVSEKFIDEFNADMDALGIERPDVAPKVTEHIPEIIGIIERLVQKEHGYVVENDGATGSDVYFGVRSFKDYGKLGRRDLDDMEAGARVEVNTRKRNPMDFALWKGVEASEGVKSWDSPWGAGRPGWHIECSAMSGKYLGETFDIHCGGKDLIFPHHENEIAQSEAASGKPMVRYWMHNGFVNIDEEKMSKSLGNFFTVRDIRDQFDEQTIRFYLLRTHYRSPINFSDQNLKEAEARVKYLYETLARLDAALTPGDTDGSLRDESVSQMVERFEASMDDDFNTAKAIGDLDFAFKLVNEILDDKGGDKETDMRTLRMIRKNLDEVGAVLGMFVGDANAVLARIGSRKQGTSGVDAAAVDALIVARSEARKSKDFARADEIRAELDAMGVVIKDSPQGTTWEVA